MTEQEEKYARQQIMQANACSEVEAAQIIAKQMMEESSNENS